MTLNTIIAQIAGVAPDSVAAGKLHSVTKAAKAHVDSLTNTITNPDSLMALTPKKVANHLLGLDWGGIATDISGQVIGLALRILAAIAIFYIGKFIINKIYSLTRAVMIAKDFDRSLTTFLLSFIKITLLFVLIITVISILGIETSSFIAIFASAGVAIGMALSGTLQNFAGGVLILLIKPYKVGDYIEFGQHKGHVKEIQIFNTVISAYNNDLIIVPNGGLATGTIKNYTADPYRRVEWKVAISYGDNVDKARQVILDIIHADKRVLLKQDDTIDNQADEEKTATATQSQDGEEKTSLWQRIFHRHKARAQQWAASQAEEIRKKLPKKDFTPIVAVDELADSAVVLVVRAWTVNANYWGVFYDINEKIYNQLPKNGLHFPFPQMDVHINPKDNA
ncbi:MAG: mechanosensitive ion channel [Muribaculaceae bacterium]|nr:mechanosensitive ion channel [Muribaculaceae bacterium]